MRTPIGSDRSRTRAGSNGGSPLKDHIVVGVLQSYRANVNSIMTGLLRLWHTIFHHVRIFDFPAFDLRRFLESGGDCDPQRVVATRTSRLPIFLSTEADRWIEDRTGLTGSYDIELTFQNDRLLLPGAQPREAPSLFTALQEQLGLKLNQRVARWTCPRSTRWSDRRRTERSYNPKKAVP